MLVADQMVPAAHAARMSQLAEDCARFLREGQLAASVSHPHTVYTFGRPRLCLLQGLSDPIRIRADERQPAVAAEVQREIRAS